MVVSKVRGSEFYIEHDKDGDCNTVTIDVELKGGSWVSFIAEERNRIWEVSFQINGSVAVDKIELNKGEKIQALRLLKIIWKSFEKYPCCCSPATDDHREAYSRLGFVSSSSGGVMEYAP